jgi:hypothetical protein
MSKPQQFVGYHNMQKFTSRIVPTFKNKVNEVILTGSSAGGFGASLNYSMVQDAFENVPVKVVDDSGPPFHDKYMPVCMQKRWREMWGLNDSLPPDCTECRQADGGGLVKMADFYLRKHPNLAIGIVSSYRDEIIRDFYAMGDDNCARLERSAPIRNFLGGACLSYSGGDNYVSGLEDLRKSYEGTGKFGAYVLKGSKHQHIWRERFFERGSGDMTMAQWMTDFINGKNQIIMP